MAINFFQKPFGGTEFSSEGKPPTQARAVRGYSNPMLGPVKPVVDLCAVDYERAAEIMRERGFTKGTGQDDDGSVCTAGALVWAVVERMGAIELSIDQSKAAIDMELGYPLVQWWNDEPQRTQEEVIDRLESTAKRLRNEGRS